MAIYCPIDFEDYQKKGDKLNIPNPNLNDPVHKNSWLQIKSNIMPIDF